MADKIDQLYDALKADGAVSKDRESFRAKMLAPGKEGYQNRLSLYNALKADGAVEANSYEDFANRLGMHAVPKQQQTSKPAPKSVQRLETAAASTSKPSKATQDKIAMGMQLQQSLNGIKDFNNQWQQTSTNNRRMLNRKKIGKDFAGELPARGLANAAGTQTDLFGYTPKAQQGEGGDGGSSVVTGESPIPAGVVYENGVARTQWQLPDGSLTTDLKQADATEYSARKERLAQQFRGRMHDNGLDPDSKEDVQKQIDIDAHNDIPYQLQQAYFEKERLENQIKQRMEDIDSQDGHSFWDIFKDASANSSTGGGALSAEKQELDKYQMDPQYRQLESALRKTNQGIQVLEDEKSGRMNEFWHSMANEAKNGYTLSGGMSDINDAISIFDAKRHIDSINRKRTDGIPLTKEELAAESVLKANEFNDDSYGQFSGDYGALARAGQMSANSIDLMTDIAMNPGGMALAKATAKGIVKGGFKAAAKHVSKALLNSATKKAVTKALLKTTGVIVGAHTGGALISNTTGLGHTAAEAFKATTGNVGRDKAGNIRLENAQNLGSALLEAERSQIRENGSEMFGEFIPGVGKLAMKGLEKLGLSKVANVLTNIGNRDWYKKFYGILEKGGYNGLPNEALEEYEGTLYDALTGHADEAWDSMKDPKTHVDIWLGCATMGALLGAGPLALNVGQYYHYKHKTANADKVASFRMGADKWNAIRDRIDATGNANMAGTVSDIMADNDLGTQEKKAALDYVRNLTKERGYNLARLNNDDDAENDDTLSANQAYSDGYEATDPKAMNDAKVDLQFAGDQLADAIGVKPDELEGVVGDSMAYLVKRRQEGASGEEVGKILEYINAKNKYDGMLQRVRDEIDDKVTEAQEQVDKSTNKSTGKLVPVKVKSREGADTDAYVIDGNIVTNPDGSVDTTKSDNSIIVQDPISGEVRMLSPEEVASVGAIQDAAEVRDAVGQATQQRLAEEAARRIDGETEQTASADETSTSEQRAVAPGEYHLNDEITLVDKNGNRVRGRINAEQNEDGLYEVETETPINGKRVNLLSGEQLDSMVEPAVRADVETENATPVDNGTPLVPPTTEELKQMARNGDELAQKQLEAQGISWDEPAAASTTEQTTEAQNTPATESASALSRIPKKENGDYAYTQTDADTAWDAIVEQAEGDTEMAQTVVDESVADAEKALEKAQKAKSKGGNTIAEKIASEKARKAAIAEAEAELNRWKEIAATQERRAKAAAETSETASTENTAETAPSENASDAETEQPSVDNSADTSATEAKAETEQPAAEETAPTEAPTKPQSVRGEEATTPKHTLTDEQREAVESIAHSLGVNGPIIWEEHSDKYNGMYDRTDGTLHLTTDSQQPLDLVFGHEATHRVRQAGEEQYSALKSAVKEYLGKQGWAAEKTRIRDMYARSKRREAAKLQAEGKLNDDAIERLNRQYDLPEDVLEEEVVADTVGKMFHDLDMAQDMATRLAAKPEGQTVLGKLRELVEKIIRKFRQMGMPEEQYRAEQLRDVINTAFKQAADKAKARLQEEHEQRFSLKGENKKMTYGERNDADSHNSSSEGLALEGNGRLSDGTLTDSKVDAKLMKNSVNVLRDIRLIQNQGGFKDKISDVRDAVRAVGKRLHMQKSQSSLSYYRKLAEGEIYESNFIAGDRAINLRVSTHPAFADNMGKSDADIKVSIVIYKDGEHRATKPHDGYTEYTFYPDEIAPRDAANAILQGVKSLIETGEFVDPTGKAKPMEYPYIDENNELRYSLKDKGEEMRSIVENAKADGTYMKAPNGKQSNLDEHQWAQVRTKAFKDWFGDWENDPENASKVVDENGEPRVIDGLFLNLKDIEPLAKSERAIEIAKEFADRIKAAEEKTGLSHDREEFVYTSEGVSIIEDMFFAPSFVRPLTDFILDENELPQVRVCFRYGDIRENMRSYNYRDNAYEKGVSVVGRVAKWNTKKSNYYESFFGDGNNYNVVIGVETDSTGADGEILLNPAYVIGQAKNIGEIVKSATDNVGTFNKENKDIRYSLKDEGEEKPVREGGVLAKAEAVADELRRRRKYGRPGGILEQAEAIAAKLREEREGGQRYSLRNPFGGNSGYVGYSMSKRAAKAREDGRYPKTDFRKEYGVSPKSFDALVDAGIIDNSEWHHTSVYGNKTTFYGWKGLGGYIYAANKKEIDKMVKGHKPMTWDEFTDLLLNHNPYKRQSTSEQFSNRMNEVDRWQRREERNLNFDYEFKNSDEEQAERWDKLQGIWAEAKKRKDAVRAEFPEDAHVEAMNEMHAQWESEQHNKFNDQKGAFSQELRDYFEDKKKDLFDDELRKAGIMEGDKQWNRPEFADIYNDNKAEIESMIEDLKLDDIENPYSLEEANIPGPAYRQDYDEVREKESAEKNAVDRKARRKDFKEAHPIPYGRDEIIRNEKKAIEEKYAPLYDEVLKKHPEEQKRREEEIERQRKYGEWEDSPELQQQTRDALTRNALIDYFEQKSAERKEAEDEANGQRYQLIGEQGAENADKAEEVTTRLDNLNVARKMENFGMDASVIKMATGWERGADGKWRYEIPDVELKDPAKWIGKRGAKLKDIITGGNVAQLFAAYPELANVKIKKGAGKDGGKFDADRNTIELNLGDYKTYASINAAYNTSGSQHILDKQIQEVLGTLLHEVQHYIQGQEGFARGGNPATIIDTKMRAERDALLKKLNGLADEYNSIPRYDRDTKAAYDIKKEYEAVNNELLALERENRLGYEGYEHLAGEVESRNVTKRMNFTDEERRAILSADTEDVSREDQIFLFGDGGENHMGSRTDKRMAEIGKHFEGEPLSKELRAIVNVFSGMKKRGTIVFTSSDGQERRMEFAQGREPKAGTRHAIMRHFENGASAFTVDDIRNISNTLSRGNRSEKGTKIVYSYNHKNGVGYTIVAEKDKGKENFVTLYTNRKASDSGVFYTQKSAHANLSDASDVANVGINPEIPAIESENNSEDEHEQRLSIRGGSMVGHTPDAAVSEAYENAVKDTRGKTLVGALASSLWTADGRKRFKNKFAESYFDYTRSVKALQEAIEKKAGQKIEAFEDVWKSLNQKSSIDEREISELNEHIVKPLMSHVAHIIDIFKSSWPSEASIDSVEMYLNSKHALERNELMTRRAAEQGALKKFADELKAAQKAVDKDPLDQNAIDALDDVKQRIHDEAESLYYDNRRDYSGLTALFDPDNDGLTIDELEDAARKYIADFEQHAGQDNIDKLWDNVHALTDFSLQKSYDCGTISREQLQQVRAMYDYYVPLRGWHDNNADEIYDYLTRGGDRGMIENALKKAHGRKSRAGMILGTMAAMANSAIVTGNKNRVAQTFMNLAENHEDTGMFTISEAWYQKNADGSYSLVAPKLRDDMTAQEVADAVADFDEDMKQKAANGDAVRRSGDFSKDFSYNLEDWKEQQHCVRVKRNGKEYLVYINGNPKATQAINGMLNPDYTPGAVDDVLRKYMRYKAQVQTSLSPLFLLSNLQRDSLTAIGGSYAKNGVGYAANVAENMVSNFTDVFRLFRKDADGTLSDSNQKERWFKEFVENGGMTGISSISRKEEYQAKYDKAVDRTTRKWQTAPAKGWEALTGGVEYVNKCIENLTRFSVYMASRQAGKGVKDAIHDAKEGSVNFNMKGSGAWGNATLRKYILYANPALQSLRMMGTWYGANKKRTIGLLAGGVAMGFMNALVNAAFNGGDDDDDNAYYGLSEYNRYNYLNMGIGNRKFLHWRLPQEMTPLYALGQIAYDASTGRLTSEEALASAVGQLNNYTPMSFIEGAPNYDQSADNTYAKTFLKAITPSAVSDFTDAYLWQEDFLGRAIGNRSDWNKYEPEWRRVDYRTPEFFVKGFETADKLTGGGEHNRNGALDSPVVNPSAVWYVLMQQGGGLAQLGQQIYNASLAILGDEHADELEARDFPFVGKVYVDAGNDNSKNRVINEKFWMYRMEFEAKDSEFSSIKSDHGMGAIQKAHRISELMSDGTYGPMKGAVNAYKKLSEAKVKAEAVGDKQKAEELKQRIADVKKTAVERVERRKVAKQ